jgi:hypothetical protein
MDEANALEFVLRGVAIGALVATAAGLWRGGKGHSARLAGVLFLRSIRVVRTAKPSTEHLDRSQPD